MKSLAGDVLPEDLLAICFKEGFVSGKQWTYGCADEATGLAGEKGAFQIMWFHREAYKVARNFEQALLFTKNRLIAKGYNKKDNRKRLCAIGAHNGSGCNGSYAKSVNYYSKQFRSLFD